MSGCQASSSVAGSRLYEIGSISAKSGVAPTNAAQLAEARHSLQPIRKPPILRVSHPCRRASTRGSSVSSHLELPNDRLNHSYKRIPPYTVDDLRKYFRCDPRIEAQAARQSAYHSPP